MKITSWENPEASLELQLGDQSINYYMISFRQLLGDFMKQFPEIFQSLLIGTKFMLINKNLNESVHDYYN